MTSPRFGRFLHVFRARGLLVGGSPALPRLHPLEASARGDVGRCGRGLRELEELETALEPLDFGPFSPRHVLEMDGNGPNRGFSTPNEGVVGQELLQLSELGRVLQQLPDLLDGCGLKGEARSMFQQSLAVFKAPAAPRKRPFLVVFRRFFHGFRRFS